MGQKVHPTAFRLGQIFDWKSRWFNKNKYRDYLKQDIQIRQFIGKKLGRVGIVKIEIERAPSVINVIIHAARPGLIIGRAGAGVEELHNLLKKHLVKQGAAQNDFYGKKPKFEIKVEINEVREPESQAAVVAEAMAEQLEKRLPFRRVLKQALEKIMDNKKVLGAKVMVKGRLGGADIARCEWLAKGKIPLQSLRANIDYVHKNAYTVWGVTGVKVWIYKGEVFEDVKTRTINNKL